MKRPATVETSLGRLSVPLPAPGEQASIGLTNWESYEGLDRVLQDRGYRVKFFKGVFEIMSISFEHEAVGGNIGSLIEAFCDWAGIDFQVWGSTTQRQEGVAGGEPDESFTFGTKKKNKPDLVVEVGLTTGGIDKVEFWRTLGAREVWVWQNNRLHGFARGDDGASLEPVTESRLLKGLKLEVVQRFASLQPTSKAVREFRAELSRSSAK